MAKPPFARSSGAICLLLLPLVLHRVKVLEFRVIQNVYVIYLHHFRVAHLPLLRFHQ